MNKSTKIFRSTTSTIELILNVLYIIIFVLAMLSPFVSPERSAWPALINVGYIFVLISLCVLIFLYLLRRKWIYFGLYALLFLLSFNYNRAYFPINLRGNIKVRQDHQSENYRPYLRVMSFNVCGFNEREEKKILAVERILKEDPDIVCLQEGILSLDETANMKSFKHYFGKKYKHIDPHFNYKNHSQGLVLLSKYPILKKYTIDYPSRGNGSVVYFLELPDSKILMLVNNHMESYTLTHDEIVSYKGAIKEKTLKAWTRLGKSLHERLGPKMAIRGHAAEKVRKEVERLVYERHPDYVVIVGDLNDTPMSYTYSQLKGKYKDAWVQTGTGIGATFNERFFVFRIDHLFYGGAILPSRSRIVKEHPRASDHNPLIVDFEQVSFSK